jgi:hypothetical protein
VPGEHRPDQAPIRQVVGGLGRRIEARMVEELPRGPHQHEAVVRVLRLRLAPREARAPRLLVEVVLPHQLVREREGVPLEIEPSVHREHHL